MKELNFWRSFKEKMLSLLYSKDVYFVDKLVLNMLYDVGKLYLQKTSGKLIRQECPFGDCDESPSVCGEWCPLFGEVKINRRSGKYVLDICSVKFIADNFEILEENK